MLSRHSFSLLPTHPSLSGPNVGSYPTVARMLRLYADYYPDLDANLLIYSAVYMSSLLAGAMLTQYSSSL